MLGREVGRPRAWTAGSPPLEARTAAAIQVTWEDLIPASAVIGDKVHELTGTVQHSQVSAAPENVDGAPTKSIEELLGISSGVAYRNDLNQKEVRVQEVPVDLTRKEFELLLYFISKIFIGD